MKRSLLLTIIVFAYSIGAAQPVNDNPCGAIALSLGTGVFASCTPSNPQSWTGATSIAGIADPGCGTINVGTTINDVWFSFIANTTGNVLINTSAGGGGAAVTDGVIAVYTATSCSNFASFTLLACDDDVGSVRMPQINMPVTNGTIYYIRLWNFYVATDGNIGGICVTNAPPPVDDNKKVGIGITYPQANLDVNGTLIVRGGNPASGKILTTDDNGLASWDGPTSFEVKANATQTIPTVTYTKVNFATVLNNDGGAYNLPTSEFIAKTAGFYHFNASVQWNFGSTSILFVKIAVYKNGTEIATSEYYNSIYFPTTSISYSTKLAINDKVTVIVYHNGVSSESIDYSDGTFFNGFKVR